MKLKRFPLGGVHPPENKLSASSPIEKMPLPELVSIPLSQHLGAPAKPIVKKGDVVKVGTKIAEAAGFISSAIHSSVSGIVQKVDDILDTTGYKRPAVIIKVEGDEWEESIDKTTDFNGDIQIEKDEIIERIKSYGIVGLGGATFPSFVKLLVPEGKKADYLVINGVECEPYLTADHRLMLEKANEIMIGIGAVKKATGIEKVIIGVENNKPDAIKTLSEFAKDYNGITVQPLKVMYPQGGEKQLIKAVLNKEVPSGGLPIDVGAVVLNVGTIFAIYEAVQKNKPLIDRVVTITGKSVSNPCNLLARIGTPINSLIEKAGGLPGDSGKVVNGGPMMGKALSTTEAPVTKGTSGVLIIKKEETSRDPEGPCIRCAKCVSVCPMGLEPYLLSANSKKYIWEPLEKECIMDCIECGSCSYTCPSSIPLLDYIRVGKAETGKIIRSRNK